MSKEREVNIQKMKETLKDNGFYKGKQIRSRHAVLNVLLQHPEGIRRCCLAHKVESEFGIRMGQPAAVIRSLRTTYGVNIPESSVRPCSDCGASGALDKLEAPFLLKDTYIRVSYSTIERRKIVQALGDSDAFDGTGGRSTRLEIDHRIPVLRRRQMGLPSEETKVDTNDSDSIKKEYQLLSRPHNLAKSRACEGCVSSGTKPSHFFLIPISENIGGGKAWEQDKNDCSSCPFAYPESFLPNLVLPHSTD